METTMTNELTVIPRTIGMMTRMMDVINTENIEDAVIVSEEEQEEHPNFIESNTSGITLEELEKNCIVPSFSDNQLTISHQTHRHNNTFVNPQTLVLFPTHPSFYFITIFLNLSIHTPPPFHQRVYPPPEHLLRGGIFSTVLKGIHYRTE